MTDFFAKLKKGIDEENIQEASEDVSVEPVAELAVVKKETKFKRKTTKKQTKKKVKVQEKKEDFDLEKVSLEKESWLEEEGELTVDVLQTGKELIIQSAIAGVEPEDLDITIENDLVIIKGEREKRFAEEKENYFFQECYWGRFSREIILPVEVDSSRAEASMKKGILTIRIPIIEEKKKKRKVSVK